MLKVHVYKILDCDKSQINERIGMNLSRPFLNPLLISDFHFLNQ